MLKNTLSVHIGWGHCDPAKIVFYPNYFIWFDQSAHHLFDKAGANMGDLMDQYGVVGLPIVDAHAEFLYPQNMVTSLRLAVGSVNGVTKLWLQLTKFITTDGLP